MRTIIFDMDGVLVDILKRWAELYNKRYNDTITPEELGAEWDGLDNRVKPECGEKIYSFLGEEGFFQGTELIDGASEYFEKICYDKRFKCYVLTACSGEPESAKGKLVFVKEHFPFFDVDNRMFLGHDKEMVDADIMIDDAEKNLVKWKQAQIQRGKLDSIAICFRAPHNANALAYEEIDYLVSSWKELYSLLDAL